MPINDHEEYNFKDEIIKRLRDGQRTNRIAKELGLVKSFVDLVYFQYLRQPVVLEALAGDKSSDEVSERTVLQPADLTSI